MNTVKIKAQPREVGKKASRAVRRAGNVPCVLYGHDAETVSFQVSALDLHGLVYTDERYRVEVKLDSQVYDCILKDVEFNPVSEALTHADFQLLRAGEKIELSIPVQIVGKAKGQLEGGDIQVIVHEIDIEALPKDIPEHIAVDISDLEIGDTIHVSDISVPGVEFVTAANQSIVTCFVRKVELEPVVEVVEGELPEGEAPLAEGAPEGEAPPAAGEPAKEQKKEE